MKQLYMVTKSHGTGLFNPVAFWLKRKESKPDHTALKNIFLHQNIGKGPPGITHGPEAYMLCRTDKNEINTLNYNLLRNPNLFHTILNFLIMKKQIFILVLALFASFKIFAQTPHDAPTCSGSAASPAVGVQYTYEVEIPNAGGYNGTGTFDWYVMTQGQLNLLTGTHIAASNAQFTASGHYDTPTASANTIDITWTSAALATGEPYFLVVVYEETLTCAANNMKVYRIEPKNAFWLAIDNVTTTQCAGNITGATINDTDNPGEVEYLYGTNTLTFTIKANGYTGNFDGVLKLGGFSADQALAVTWSGSSGGSGSFTAPATINGDYTATLPSVASTTGEVITVTVVVTNNHFQNLTGQTIDIAIDGSFTSGGTTFNDLSDVNGACTPENAFADAVQQTITARPTINPTNPTLFVPQVNP